jgi:hypothetical protein
VVGLSRSESGSEALTRSGAESADGVIHAAFNHDFANLKKHSEEDRKVIETLGEVLAGSDRPLVITSGTGVARSKTGDPAVEADNHVTSAEFPRAASEEAADTLIADGGRVMVIRLPQVHDTRRFGRITQHIQLARKWGRGVCRRGQEPLAALTLRAPKISSPLERYWRMCIEACPSDPGEPPRRSRKRAVIHGSFAVQCDASHRLAR